MVADETVDNPSVSQDLFLIGHQEPESQSSNQLIPPALDEECELMESAPSNDAETSKPMLENFQCSYPVSVPAYFSPYFPFPLPFWPGCTMEQVERETHEIDFVERETHKIVKSTAVHSKSPINVDELVGMSSLSMGESANHLEPGRMATSALSLKLMEGSTRQSAFHTNPTSGSSSMNSSSPIHAV